MKMVKSGKIKPVIYEEEYHGLEAVPQGLKDMGTRKVWGRAVVTVSDPEQKIQRRYRL